MCHDKFIGLIILIMKIIIFLIIQKQCLTVTRLLLTLQDGKVKYFSTFW